MRDFCLIGVLVISLQASATSNAASRQASRIWLEAKEQTTCEAMQADYCLGRYGFAIKQDGTFTAGPTDRGTKIEGRIEMAELQRLGELIGALSSERRSCEPGGLVGIKDQVDITFAVGSVVRLYDLGNRRICYFDSKASAQEIHGYVRGLMTKYYPIPFSKR
jgi:hypothetical protein